jgi:hypothetical protein
MKHFTERTRNCKVLRLFFIRSEKTKADKFPDHFVVDNEEPNSPTRRPKNSEILGSSPARSQNRKGSRRSGSLISPTHSPTSAKMYGSSSTRSQNGKRAQIDAPNQGQEQNIQAATRQTHVGRTSMKPKLSRFPVLTQ